MSGIAAALSGNGAAGSALAQVYLADPEVGAVGKQLAQAVGLKHQGPLLAPSGLLPLLP